MNETPPPTTDATGRDDKFSWWNVWLFLAQRVFLYFVIYALSIGPFYWEWYKSRYVDGSSVLAAFYLPLVWVAEVVPPFGEWMNWYIHLWTG